MKTSPIFRQEAVLYAAQGRIRPFYTPMKTHYLIVMMGLMVCSLLATGWLVSQQYIRYQTVVGRIEPVAGVQTHHSPLQGRLVEQFVEIGQTVQKGDVLMLVASLNFMASGISLVEAQRSLLGKQQNFITQQHRRQVELDHQRHNMLTIQSEGAERKLALLKTAQKDSEQILQMAVEQYERAKRLFEQGHLAEASLLDKQEKMHRMRLQLLNVKGDLAAQDALLISINQQLNSLVTEQALSKSRHDSTMNNLALQLIDLEGQGLYAIVAGQSGVVDSIDIHMGDDVRPGQPMLTILPNNARLVGVLNIPVQAAGFVSEGQSVALRYSAYPYQKYGIHQGTIEQLSETPKADTRGNFFYTAKVALDDASVLAHGKRYPLKTGMGFEADVVLSRRSFAEWLFEPLYSLRGASTR
jgi:membrane fusion protein